MSPFNGLATSASPFAQGPRGIAPIASGGPVSASPFALPHYMDFAKIAEMLKDPKLPEDQRRQLLDLQNSYALQVTNAGGDGNSASGGIGGGVGADGVGSDGVGPGSGATY